MQAVLRRGDDAGLPLAPELDGAGALGVLVGRLASDQEPARAEADPGAGEAGGPEQAATGQARAHPTVAATRESGSASASICCERAAVSSVESS